MDKIIKLCGTISKTIEGIKISWLVQLGLWAGLFVGMSSWSFADSQRILDFEYDQAGHVTRIISSFQTDPPDVVEINPPFINIGRTVRMTATGFNLLQVQITTAEPGLIINSISSTLNEAIFDLTANDEAAVGTASLTFTTGLGSDVETIIVADRVPDLLTVPNPISVPPNGAPTAGRLVFVEPLPADQTFSVSIADPSIAGINQATVTFAAGETSANLEITGLLAGSTALNVNAPAQFFFNSFPVYVMGAFTGDENGNAGAFSRPVQLLVGSGDLNNVMNNPLASRPVTILVGPDDPDSVLNNPILSAPVGITVGSNEAGGVENNPFLSLPVGIAVGSNDTAGAENNPFLSMPVGLLVGPDDPDSVLNNPVLSSSVGIAVGSNDVSGGDNNPILSALAGVLIGPVLSSAAPVLLDRGTSVNVAISGFNLQSVNSITLVPAEDVSLGVFNVSPDGSEITVPVTVDANAVVGSREVVVATPDGEISVFNGPPLEWVIQ